MHIASLIQRIPVRGGEQGLVHGDCCSQGREVRAAWGVSFWPDSYETEQREKGEGGKGTVCSARSPVVEVSNKRFSDCGEKVLQLVRMDQCTHNLGV